MNASAIHLRPVAITTSLMLSVALVLTSCGGGQGDAPQAKDIEAEEAKIAQADADDRRHSRGLYLTDSLDRLSRGGSNPGWANAHDAAYLAQGARQSGEELQAAEQQAQAAEKAQTRTDGEQANAPATDLSVLTPGQIAPKSVYASGGVAAKAAAVRIPVFRFHNGSTGAHFYTTSTAERDQVQANLSPPFSFEGPAFSVASAFSPGLHPVHRFFNTRSGVHFYTISEAERANVAANLPHFNYEGVAYHASQVAGTGLVPFYRFYVPSRGFHFYTASVAERNNIQANLSAIYTYEGVGYHVLDSDWRAEKLPHSGVTAQQCFEPLSNNLAPCSSTVVTDFNAHQDGHRAHINPMSYSAVGGRPLSSCVRDNVTGLFWEGKEATGTRAGNRTFTNLDNGAPSDASGYVTAVNAMNLCGFNDWRMPTRLELLTLVDNQYATGIPISTTWFPNTAPANTWSAQGRSLDSDMAWYTSFVSTFGGGSSNTSPRSDALAVRLVRGTMGSGPRFSFSSVAYGSDGPNNVVNDAWTGLQWRRCEQGRAWSGSTCTGTATMFNFDEALAHARQQNGWRIPNVKELASLTDLGVNSGARINHAAFPGASAGYQWTSTPPSGWGGGAQGVYFAEGRVLPIGRTINFVELRLLRINP